MKLTLASCHYQLRERHDLERVTSQLPEGVVCHGWLGDNVLVSSDFDASAFCRTLAGEGIYMTVREFPADEDADYAKFHEVKGMVYNRAPLTDRQKTVAGLRLRQAVAISKGGGTTWPNAAPRVCHCD